MTARGLGRIVGQNLRRSPRDAALSLIAVSLGITTLVFFTGLETGVRDGIVERAFRVDRIEFEPAKTSFDLPLFGGGVATIGDDAAEKLRRLPGVRSVARRLRLDFPAKAWGGATLFGVDRYAEVIGEGMDPAAFAGEPVSPEPFADLEGGPPRACRVDADCPAPAYCPADLGRCERPVPVLLSRTMLELYNTAFAPSHGLPKIGDFLVSRFRGFTFHLGLGESMLSGVSRGPRRGTPRERRAMLVGVSDRAVPFGLTFPLPYVERWNREYGGAARGYTSLVVEVTSERAVAEVAAAGRTLGLAVVDSGAERAGIAVTLVGLLFQLLSVALLGLATIGIAQNGYRAVSERRREIGLLRALGATPGEIQAIVLSQAAFLGLLGVLLGLAAAWLASLGADWAAGCFLPDFPFKPESFFRFPPTLLLFGLAAGLGASLGGALWPARTAARIDPGQALAST